MRGQLHSPSLDLGQIENVIDQGEQVTARTKHAVERFGVLLKRLSQNVVYVKSFNQLLPLPLLSESALYRATLPKSSSRYAAVMPIGHH
jgi:hypothetical protein